MPVATITRRTFSVPSAVCTVAIFLVKVVRRTGERSNRRAPRASAAAATPSAARNGIHRGAVSRPERGGRGNARFGRDRAGVHEHRFEPGVFPRLLLLLQKGHVIRIRRDREEAVLLELAFEIQPARERDEVERGAAPRVATRRARRGRPSSVRRRRNARPDRRKSIRPRVPSHRGRSDPLRAARRRCPRRQTRTAVRHPVSPPPMTATSTLKVPR